MKTTKLFLSALGLFGTFGVSTAPVWAKDGVLLQVKAEAGNYCHLKFPAIREETLSWASPVLKDAASGEHHRSLWPLRLRSAREGCSPSPEA